MAIPEDGRVRVKEDENVEKYQDLVREIQKMWGIRTQPRAPTTPPLEVHGAKKNPK